MKKIISIIIMIIMVLNISIPFIYADEEKLDPIIEYLMYNDKNVRHGIFLQENWTNLNFDTYPYDAELNTRDVRYAQLIMHIKYDINSKDYAQNYSNCKSRLEKLIEKIKYMASEYGFNYDKAAPDAIKEEGLKKIQAFISKSDTIKDANNQRTVKSFIDEYKSQADNRLAIDKTTYIQSFKNYPYTLAYAIAIGDSIKIINEIINEIDINSNNTSGKTYQEAYVELFKYNEEQIKYHRETYGKDYFMRSIIFI